MVLDDNSEIKNTNEMRVEALPARQQAEISRALICLSPLVIIGLTGIVLGERTDPGRDLVAVVGLVGTAGLLARRQVLERTRPRT